MCHALIFVSLIAVNVGNDRPADAVNNNLLATRIESTTLNNLVGPCRDARGTCVGAPTAATRPPVPAGAHARWSHVGRWGVVGRPRRAWAQRRRRLWFRPPRACR